MKYLDIKVDTQVASADLFAYAMLKHEKNVEIKVASANKSKKVVTLLSGDPRLKCGLINEKRDYGAVGRRGSLAPILVMIRPLTILLIFVPVILFGQKNDLKVDFNFKMKHYDDYFVTLDEPNNEFVDIGDTIYSCKYDEDKRIIAEFYDYYCPYVILYSYDKKGRILKTIKYQSFTYEGERFVLFIDEGKYHYNNLDSVSNIDKVIWNRRRKDEYCRQPITTTQEYDSVKKQIVQYAHIGVKPKSDGYTNYWDRHRIFKAIKYKYNKDGYKIYYFDKSYLEGLDERHYRYNENNQLIQETDLIKMRDNEEKDNYFIQTQDEHYYKYYENYYERTDTLRMNYQIDYIVISKYELDKNGLLYKEDIKHSTWIKNDDAELTYRNIIKEYMYLPGTNKLLKITECMINKDNGKCEVISERNYHYK